MPSIDISRYDKKKTKPGKPEKDAGGGIIAFLNRDISFGKKELSDKKKEYLYLELSSLLMAGIDFKRSFEMVTADQEKPKDKELFEQIRESVMGGNSFSTALQQSGKFSLYEVYSIQIGEESGKLTEVMENLARYYQNKIKQRRKIISSLTYPGVVLSSSLGAVFFMMKFVVPMFGDVLKRFGGQLPWITEEVISLSKDLETYFWPVTVLMITIAGFLWYVRQTENFRRISSRFFLRIPVIGDLVKKIYLARFCNAMRLLINARLPLLKAIALSKKMIGYYPIESSLQKVEDDILQGRSLHESLQQFGFYPSKMIQLLKIGEESNKMDYFFAKIAEQYIEEVEYKTTSLSNSMQPIITFALGAIVGTILIAMYLPMFQMSNNLQ